MLLQHIKVYTMADTKENEEHVAHAGGDKKAKIDIEQLNLKKRIQRHYDVTSEQFLKVWYGDCPTVLTLYCPTRWLTAVC